MKILIIEDEPTLRDDIASYLSQEKNVCSVAGSLFEAEDKLSVHTYDIILLDISLPDGNGLKILQFVKKINPKSGVIIVSAKNSLDDRLVGLDLGADDYITKPFHFAELNSRIKAVYRRHLGTGTNELTFREIVIHLDSKSIHVGNKALDVTKKEYMLAVFLLTNANKVITKEAIAEHLWGDDASLLDNFDFIYTHIKNLRKKILAAGGMDYLKTVYGMGYMFSTDV